MSGKKLTEVTDVLKNADVTREEMFHKKSKDIDTLIKQCNLDISKYQAEESTKDEVKAKNRVLDKIQSLGREVEAIENKIRQKAPTFESWAVENYDDEFARAAQVLDSYKQASQELTSINGALKRKHNKILEVAEKMEKAKAKVTRVEEQLKGMLYTNPYKKSQAYSLEEACENILDDKKVYSDMISVYKGMNTAFTSGKYEKTIEKSESCEKKLEEIDERFEHATIKIKENAQVMLSIEDELDGKVEFTTEVVDNKPCKGFIIRTLDGTLEVDLTNVFEHDDGQSVGLNINDEDSKCKVTASKLVSAVKKAGINIEVTDWGRASESKKVSGSGKRGGKTIRQGGNG